MDAVRKRVLRLVLIVVTALSTQAYAQQLYVYPAKGQSQDQQNNDEAACYRFGRQQSGFDPMQAPTATSAEPEAKGSVGGGLFKGALLGLAVGAVAGDAGKGAAIGAVGGGLFGGMRHHQGRVEQQQWADQQAANYQNNRSNYNRAYAACLEGRGYTVN
jgi:predicted lipid-binding transport protein (Tim44 family)